MAAALAAPFQPPSPTEVVESFRSTWSPDHSPCAQSPAEIELPKAASKARQVLWARRADLPSYCLMEAAALWAGDDNTRAAELFMRGRVRYRYDKGRCVNPKGRNAYDDFHWALTVNFSQVVQAGKTLGAASETIDALLTRLAADPSTFPATPPDEQVCDDPSGGVVPAARWPAAADKLRAEMTAAP